MIGIFIFLIIVIVYLFYFGSRKIDSIEKEIEETKKNRSKMRSFTKKEAEEYNKILDNISESTGENFYRDLEKVTLSYDESGRGSLW